MQQRRPRLGDILDDYCPRERRITNHAVVAMIDDQVKQTRCTTCDADHEYKHAKVPAPRRKKDSLDQPDDAPVMDDSPIEAEAAIDDEDSPGDAHAAADAAVPAEAEVHAGAADEGEDGVDEPREDDGPVHRRLIRATLPRPEGQTPERKAPEFTVRQPGGRGREFDGNRGAGGGGGQRPGRTRRAMRGDQQGPSTGPSRFGGGPRHNSPQGQRQNSNRPPGPGGGGGQRGGGRPQGQSRGGGRKRGR
jgi:hypothetical protein